jgi:hypothetical protein
MDKEIDPEISKLERDALLEYQQEEQQNLLAKKQEFEQANAIPNWRDLELDDPRLAKDYVPPQYTAPDFLTEEGMVDRGFFDGKGGTTKLGDDYVFLEERGIFNDGQLTLKGEALITPESEMFDTGKLVDNNFKLDESDAKNIELYNERKKLGIDKPDVDKSFWDYTKELGKGIAGMAESISVAIDPWGHALVTGEKEEDVVARAKASYPSIAKGALSVAPRTIVGATRLGEKYVALPIAEATGLMSEEQVTQYNKERDYRAAAVKKTYSNIAARDIADVVGMVESYDQADLVARDSFIAQYGEEEGNQKYEEAKNSAEVVGEVVADPLNVVLPVAAIGVRNAANLIKTARTAKATAKGFEAINHGQNLLAARAPLAANLAKVSEDIAKTSELLDDAVKIGNSTKITDLTANLDDLVANRNKLTNTLSVIDDGVENASKQANKMEIAGDSIKKASDVGRTMAAGAANAVGNSAEFIGNVALKSNSFLRKVEKAVGFRRVPWLVSASLAVPFGKVIAPYVGARIGLTVAPRVMNRVAKFSSVLSEEIVKRTSSTPFFRRVAGNEKVGRLGGALATVADYSTPFARGTGRVGAGVAEAAPYTFLYNAINDMGVDGDTIQKSGRDALIFGGLGRVIGGKTDFNKRMEGDLFNYREKLKADPEKLSVFDGIRDTELRQFAATMDASYPGFFDWDFTTSGNNFFDPVNRKAVVNINDKSGFMKAVAAHEIGHMIQFRHQNDSAIVSMMLGDETQRGLVRNADGSLDPEFKAWSDEYNQLRKDNDLAAADLGELAIEYYTDIGTQTLLEDVLGGRMTRQAVKTPVRRGIEQSFDVIFSKIPIVKELHFKMGGALDKNGRMVAGSGLLADGIKELPEVKAMVRKAYDETAGRPVVVKDTVADAPSSNPNHYKGQEIIDRINKEMSDAGKPLPPNALIPDETGNGTGFLSDDHIKALEEAGVIDNGEFGKALHLQTIMDDSQKFAVSLINKPIRQGRSIQFGGGFAEGLVVPTQWKLRNGRLYLEAMDLRQLNKNVDRLSKSEMAKELRMTRQNILDDIQDSVAIQNKGLSTDDFYKAKDPVNWKKRKNFINSVIGKQTTAQTIRNPMLDQLSPSLETGIYRTFAFDRLQSVVKMGDNVSIPFGANSYYSIRDNLMPQSPRVNRNGELVPEVVDAPGVRFMPQGKRKGKPTATRLAEDLAKKNKVPLSKVTASGANGTITPNDIRAYIATQEGKFKPLAFQKEPAMAIEPTISDLVGTEVSYQGNVGKIIDDQGRPALEAVDGSLYELPFSFFTDESARQLGIKPIGNRVKDKAVVIKQFEPNSQIDLQSIFGYIDDLTDKVVGLAELGVSLKRSKNKKAVEVMETPEFQGLARGITDSDILHAWERTEKALNKTREAKNLSNEQKTAIIEKLEGDIRNLERLSQSIDLFKQQRISSKAAGETGTSKVSGISQADLISQLEIERRAGAAIQRASAPTSRISPRNAALLSPSQPRRSSVQPSNKGLASSISSVLGGKVANEEER